MGRGPPRHSLVSENKEWRGFQTVPISQLRNGDYLNLRNSPLLVHIPVQCTIFVVLYIGLQCWYKLRLTTDYTDLKIIHAQNQRGNAAIEFTLVACMFPNLKNRCPCYGTLLLHNGRGNSRHPIARP